MAAREKTKIVDSFTTLKAAQRRVQEQRAADSPSPSAPVSRAESPPSDSAAKKIGTHIGRTVMPTKYEIVCYSCGFDFKITGKARQTYCPKCRSQLDLTDHSISGHFDGELVTAGTVTLTQSSILDGGRITANNVVLEGTVKSGHLEAHRTLELAQGAVIPQNMIRARNLRIAASASVTLKKKATFRDVDVLGEFQADLWADGLVTIHPGGHLKGTLHTSHLSVVEGGGLTADVHVTIGEPPPTAPDAESGSAKASEKAPEEKRKGEQEPDA